MNSVKCSFVVMKGIKNVLNFYNVFDFMVDANVFKCSSRVVHAWDAWSTGCNRTPPLYCVCDRILKVKDFATFLLSL